VPIANAAALRLRDAVQEYLQSIAGDTGSRRQGGVNRRVNDEDRETYELANNLLGRLDGDTSSPAEQRSTPGARARDRAMQGPGDRPAVNRGDGMWPVLRNGGGAAVMNGAAGKPAAGGNQGDSQ
jgi:hypothetical protein